VLGSKIRIEDRWIGITATMARIDSPKVSTFTIPRFLCCFPVEGRSGHRRTMNVVWIINNDGRSGFASAAAEFSSSLGHWSRSSNNGINALRTVMDVLAKEEVNLYTVLCLFDGVVEGIVGCSLDW
jgi:hypothetical protein